MTKIISVISVCRIRIRSISGWIRNPAYIWICMKISWYVNNPEGIYVQDRVIGCLHECYKVKSNFFAYGSDEKKNKNAINCDSSSILYRLVCRERLASKKNLTFIYKNNNNKKNVVAVQLCNNKTCYKHHVQVYQEYNRVTNS